MAPCPVTTDHPIFVGVFDGFSWIRCEGKGSFLNSPAVKAFGDERISAGESLIVVDLGACTGMDSTFMGTLAGMASRISALGEGVLQIAEPSERNRRSLEDLGLDFLMEIDPPAAIWRVQVAEIRNLIKAPQPPGPLGRVERAHHILEAHQMLTGVNDKNAREFSTVIDTLKTELSADDAKPKPKPKGGDGPS